ncbi:MAG TPA: isochorismatase family protein [Acidobacteria bacterium]|nr:isochorismatase family protein [Acidobacteriota bacterium]
MSSVELLDASRSLLLVIDLQGKLMEMIARPDLVVAGTRRLMEIAEIFEVPVLLTEQYPQGLGPTHPQVRQTFDQLRTRKDFLTKTSFGCCGDDGFGRALDGLLPGIDASRRQIVVAGIEAHICVMQTTVELLRAGHQVHLCWECISSRGEEYRRHALDRMQQAGAQLTNHESVGFEWARDAGHPGFRQLNRLLRQGQLT